MAEFQDVMKQAKRMCNTVVDCDECPVRDMFATIDCPFAYNEVHMEDVEQSVMDWAAKHPEPRYPSWIEWQGANFQMAERAICAAHFMDVGDAGCYEIGRCDKCRERPIPADIAEKLGIKPIGGDSE